MVAEARAKRERRKQLEKKNLAEEKQRQKAADKAKAEKAAAAERQYRESLARIEAERARALQKTGVKPASTTAKGRKGATPATPAASPDEDDETLAERMQSTGSRHRKPGQRAEKLREGLQAVVDEQPPEFEVDLEDAEQRAFFDDLTTSSYGQGPVSAMRHFTEDMLKGYPWWKLCYLRGLMKAHKKPAHAWAALETLYQQELRRRAAKGKKGRERSVDYQE
jgi:hypothetical protein